MKTRILQNAHSDIPLYFEDFKQFWDNTLTNISEDELFEVYKTSLVFKNWKIVFHSIGLTDFDQLINELYEDINSSLFLCLLGLHRSAHMHLRSSIELTLQLIYFIHHPIEYKKWKEGEFVIKHSPLIEYIRSHPNYTIDIKAELEQITRNWKHFSKHIHGESPLFFQCVKDARLTNDFARADFGPWYTNYQRCITMLNKILLFFFKEDVPRFPEVSRQLLTSYLTTAELTQLTT